MAKNSLYNSLEDIIGELYSDKSTKKMSDYNNKNIYKTNENYINYIKKDYSLYPKKIPSQPISRVRIPSNPTPGPINWGGPRPVVSERAYVQPSPQDVERILASINYVVRLPEDQQRLFVDATQEMRYFLDGAIRAKFGATRHFNAIRCLNDPTRTNVADLLSRRNVQLAGEEFFGLNRFMPNIPDIADVQWWAVYADGSWQLDTWNPEGEHLDTGFNGWGNLVCAVLKVNGQVLTPNQTVAFYRTLKLRDEQGFMTQESMINLQAMLNGLTQRRLPRGLEQHLELAHDLGLVEDDSRTLTYIGESMITPTKALLRKERQLTETNPRVRRIIDPVSLN